MFTHLHLHSPYSFLDGASDIEVLVRRAASFGMEALALTDHNSLAAAVKFSSCCEGYGIKPILGAELTLEDDSHLTLLARNRAGYANLCVLISLAHAHGGRLSPRLPWEALEAHAENLVCLTGCRLGRVSSLTRAHCYEEAEKTARRLRHWFGREQTFIELQDDFTPDSRCVAGALRALAERLGVGAVCTNNVHYATRRGFITHDVLRCIAAGVTVAETHPLRPLNFERYLKSGAEMLDLFYWAPEALEATARIAAQCEPALPRNEQITPSYPCPEGHDAASYLRKLAYKGADARYCGLPAAVTARLEHELAVIVELGYADYFLMAWKIARWARQAGIRCTGRGSAADSCVAFALKLTDVDVIARNLPFARFLAPGKMPDIDLDFASTRRDDVFRYIQQEYGEENVAMACTFHTFLAKSALRDVGKVLDLPPDILRFFSKNMAGFVRADTIEAAFEKYAELKPHAHLIERFKLLFALCGKLAGFPRHLGTHSSGVVVSRAPIRSLAPMQPTARGVMPLMTLDKDDVEEIGAIKLDVLSLRILAAVQDSEADIQRSEPEFRYDHIPFDDPETYRQIQAGRATGVFQLESPAQMALATVLHPEHFEDLVASVALIRPGPIRSQAVKRFVACRNGWMRADVLHPALAPVLAKTYGCVVFQEQVVQVIAIMLGCSDAEADRLRKQLGKHDKLGTMEEAAVAFMTRARATHPDISPERALRIWQQIETWSGYGFTEGHAASFAITAAKTAFLARHHPAEYFAALMSNQPMGYYCANSLAAEARRQGVQIRPVCINRSEDACYAEEPDAIRLGMRLMEDMREADIAAILKARASGPFVSLLDFCARVPLHMNRLENLVLGGAFDGLHEHRRGLFWQLEESVGLARAYRAGEESGLQEALRLGRAAEHDTPVAWELADHSSWEKMLWEWRITGVCAGAHPFAHLRENLGRWRILTTYDAQQRMAGERVTVAGLNIRPHRPPTRSGRSVLFATLEDETDTLQLICSGEALALTPVFLLSPAIIVRGILQRKGQGVSLKVERAKALRMSELAAPDPVTGGEESPHAPDQRASAIDHLLPQRPRSYCSR